MIDHIIKIHYAFVINYGVCTYEGTLEPFHIAGLLSISQEICLLISAFITW